MTINNFIQAIRNFAAYFESKDLSSINDKTFYKNSKGVHDCDLYFVIEINCLLSFSIQNNSESTYCYTC